ncbi:MAG: hypothetical protein ACHQEM_06945 [Chitinophagales bacterium]
MPANEDVAVELAGGVHDEEQEEDDGPVSDVVAGYEAEVVDGEVLPGDDGQAPERDKSGFLWSDSLMPELALTPSNRIIY